MTEPSESRAPFRYAYVSNGLTDHRLPEALELLAENGYTGIALTLDHVHFDPFTEDWPARAGRLRAKLDELDFGVVVETGARYILDRRRKHYPNLLSADSDRRVSFLERSIEIAAEVGAPVVSLWSGTAPAELDHGAAWDLLLTGCERILPHADRLGVRLGFEPEPGMLVERIADYERLADALGHPESLRMTLDIGHCVCVEDQPVADCIRGAESEIVHVHIEDMRRGVHEHLPFGQGELDLTAAVAALGEIGYSGLVAVELSRDSHRAAELVPASIKALRAAETASSGE